MKASRLFAAMLFGMLALARTCCGLRIRYRKARKFGYDDAGRGVRAGDKSVAAGGQNHPTRYQGIARTEAGLLDQHQQLNRRIASCCNSLANHRRGERLLSQYTAAQRRTVNVD